MKNMLAFLTEYKSEKAKLKAQEEKVNNMLKEIEKYTIEKCDSRCRVGGSEGH